MTPIHRQAIDDFMRGKLAESNLSTTLGIDLAIDRDFVPACLRMALVEHIPEDISRIMFVAFYFHLCSEWAPLLVQVLAQDWHTAHEDLAEALQDLRDPISVDVLFATARRRYPYLCEDDYALGTKCIWALHDIGNAPAIEYLRQLATSQVEAIRQTASARLSDLMAAVPGVPKKLYRMARDKNVRWQ